VFSFRLTNHALQISTVFSLSENGIAQREIRATLSTAADILFIKMLIRYVLFSINQKNDHCSFSYFQALEEEHREIFQCSRNTDYILCFPLNLTNHNEDRSILACRKNPS